jgi:hypothetical protein
MEMLAWGLMLTEPPMVTYKELMDGTYDIDDILRMNVLIKYKNDMAAQAEAKRVRKTKDDY